MSSTIPVLKNLKDRMPSGRAASVVTLHYDKAPNDSKRYEAKIMVMDDQPMRAADVARKAFAEWCPPDPISGYPKVVSNNNVLGGAVLAADARMNGNAKMMQFQIERIGMDDYRKTWKEVRKYNPFAAWYDERMKDSDKYMPRAFWMMKRDVDGNVKTI